MASSDASFFGLAKQTGIGVPNVTAADFDYMLFKSGGMAPNNIIVPLDDEIGGGAMTRDVKKMGVSAAGALEFIPRPKTLGKLLMGAFGLDTIGAVLDGTAYPHVFTLGADQFDAPYYSVRSAPGNVFGETFQDIRVSSLSLQFAANDFVRGAAGFIGGKPSKVATTAWNPQTYLDGGPEFIGPKVVVTLPDGAVNKVVSGSFTAGMVIPLDQQWVLGSNYPVGFNITRRAFAVSFVIKVTDGDLYTKVNYDPAATGVWAATIMRDAQFSIEVATDELAGAATEPYSLKIEGNGGVGALGNMVWAAQPIGMRSGQEVVMSVNGIFLADNAAAPITATLVNKQATAY